ncbi:MAG: hypothetical protein ABIG37_01020 [Nanoarchaeota archaeon]
MNKKSQSVLGISFGMIFSVILIIMFIVIAFYAINVFLDIKNCGQIGIFKQDLQNEINRAWSSQETSSVFDGILPSKIKEICFLDMSSSGKGKNIQYYEEIQKYSPQNINMFFMPIKTGCGELGFKLENIDIQNITKDNNPYCIIKKEKTKIRIEKGFYEGKVRLSEEK